MCPRPRLANGPVYGTNDWYYAYGKNTAAGILRDTDLVVALAPKSGVRPFSVIAGGWEGDGATARGQEPNPNFPDMAALAEQSRKRGARPGIWIRPLEAAPGGLRPMRHRALRLAALAHVEGPPFRPLCRQIRVVLRQGFRNAQMHVSPPIAQHAVVSHITQQRVRKSIGFA